MEREQEFMNSIRKMKARIAKMEANLELMKKQESFGNCLSLITEFVKLKNAIQRPIKAEPGGFTVKPEPPKFKEGEWLYNTVCDFIQRYRQNEGYSILDNGAVNKEFRSEWSSTDEIYINNGFYIRATPEQIERILIKVAEYKGYKEGVTVISVASGNNCKLRKGMFLSNDCLYCYAVNQSEVCIYYNGEWAEIIPEEKTEIEKFLEWAYNKGWFYENAIGTDVLSYDWRNITTNCKLKTKYLYEMFKEETK